MTEITEAVAPPTEITMPPIVPKEPPVNGSTAPEVIAAVATILKEAQRRPATFNDLLVKKNREIPVVINSQDSDGKDIELVLTYRALGNQEYDALVAKYPPNSKQKADGYVYNPDTFGPALVAAVCIDPVLSIEQVTTIMSSGQWSTGEVNTLTGSAFALCQAGASVPFTVSV